MATSDDGGATWSMPRAVVDNYPGPGHQIMPALDVRRREAGHRLLRLPRDGIERVRDVRGRDGGHQRLAVRRHTVELRSAMAEPASAPVFTDYTVVSEDGAPNPSTQVSRYLFGSFGQTGVVAGAVQPAEPADLRPGHGAVHRRLHRHRGPDVTVDANREWQFNTAARRLARPAVPRRVDGQPRRPQAADRQTWANYKSPTLGPNDTVCDPGSNPGSRNQNIYTAPADAGPAW